MMENLWIFLGGRRENAWYSEIYKKGDLDLSELPVVF